MNIIYPKTTIQNVVCTMSFGLCGDGGRLDLHALTNTLPNTEYRPQRFSAMVIRIQQPVRAVGLLFATGRLVCVGTKSIPDSQAAMEHFASLIGRAAKIATRVNDFVVRNVVASFTLGRPLNLHALYDALRFPAANWQCSYNPEMFPGMCLRRKQQQQQQQIVILLFSTGKAVITGARCEQQIQQTLETVYPILQQFLK